MTVVVAGGTRGIGWEIARALSRPGEGVVLGFRSDAEAAATAVDALTTAGSRAIAVPVDMGTPEGCAELIAAAVDLGDPITHVVHSVGEVVTGPLMDMDLHAIAHAWGANGTSLLWLAREARPHLQRGSTILYVTSRGARAVYPGYGSLGPAKALAEALVRYLAVELAPHGIRVNALAPGAQDTVALRSVFGDATDAILESSRAKNPSGRLVEPADYTPLAVFLTSPEASMITGQVFYVHGGADLLS